MTIAKGLIDNFGRVGRIIKRRATKIPEPCTFLPALRYTGSSDAPSDIVARGNDDSAARRRRVEKGEKERDRPNEWRGIDTRNIGYTTEYASTILLSPSCPLLLIPTLLPRPTWPTGLCTACVHARINKRSIHYL